uniref:TOD1/MUCI70 glycosyltransferase-like domain-containing protein n=1 Tax=viral metagenome TaxID=1070528 RepID=A0A6M3L5C0_9ZZZZ
MKIIQYTAITNSKDTSREDIMCFNEYNKFINPVMNAKIYKVLPHKFLDCDVSIYMDGNIYLLKEPEWYVKNWLGDNDMAFFRHYKSKNLDWELKWIKYVWRSKNRQVYEDAIKQVEYYKKIGLPEQKDMAMGGVIIRRHIPLVENFNEAWWSEICRWGQRDQLSLPIVLRKFPELKVNRINENIKTTPNLRYETHKHFKT